MNKRTQITLILGKFILDALCVFLSFMAAYYLRFYMPFVPVIKGVPLIGDYLHAMPAIITVFLAVFKWSRFYEENWIIYKTDEFLNIIRAVTVSIIIATAATFIYREISFSRLVIGYAYVLCIILVYFNHRFIRHIKLRYLIPVSGKIGILVIGGQKIKDTILKNLSKHSEFMVYFYPSIDFTLIDEYISRKSVKEIILADSGIDRQLILKLINLCERKNLEFKMVPDMLELKMGEMSFDNYFGIPVLNLKHPLFEPSNYYTKRVFDILLTMAGLILLGPFLVIVMIMIKLDSSGPVFYNQLRKGFKGSSFRFYKFRSMVLDADDKLKELIKYNERQGPVFKMKNDPRITKMGKFIRKYSIDELPQLINVLKGNMSLVGPRPQVLWEAAAYNEEAKRRLNVLPGITGLWQISGRSELSYDDMIRLDLYYLENWTPGLDMKIIMKTIPVVMKKRGAY
ncbi:sugar transferase [Elusimicrobiota bacterium]